MKVLKGITTTLLVILLILIMFEGILWFLHATRIMPIMEIDRANLLVGRNVYDEDLGWKNRANFSAPVEFPHGTFQENMSSQGWRDIEYNIDKPSDLYRIAVLGCSRSYGYGVNVEDAYPKQLERILRSKLDKEIEIMNCAVVGYGLDQMVLNYIKLVDQYNPDLVILQLYPTSVGRSRLTKLIATSKPKFILKEGKLFLENHPVPEHMSVKLESWLLEKSLLARLMKIALFTVERYQQKPYFENLETNQDVHALCTEILKYLNTHIAESDKKLIVFTWGQNREWLQQICRNANVEVFNIYDFEEFKEWAQKGNTENPPPIGHWSPHGNHFVATAFYNYLKANNIGGIFQ